MIWRLHLEALKMSLSVKAGSEHCNPQRRICENPLMKRASYRKHSGATTSPFPSAGCSTCQDMLSCAISLKDRESSQGYIWSLKFSNSYNNLTLGSLHICLNVNMRREMPVPGPQQWNCFQSYYYFIPVDGNVLNE